MSGSQPNAVGSNPGPFGGGAGGGGLVSSVFGRVGAVVAVLGDYAASLVSNDSGVAGVTVKAALDNLNASIAAALAVANAKSGTVTFGANAVGATTTTRYLYPAYDDSLAETSPVQWRAPRSGTLRNAYLIQNIPNGNGSDIVYTLRKGGAATAISITIASTTSLASDTANTVAVAAGDLLDIEITKAASVGTTPNNIVLTMEFV